MTAATRQVDDVTIVDLSGQIKLGEGVFGFARHGQGPARQGTEEHSSQSGRH